MAVYVARRNDVVTFEPVDGLPVEPLSCTMSYFTELRGLRIAFVETVVDMEDEQVNLLKTGRVGRFAIRNRSAGEGVDDRNIPVAIITCISQPSTAKGAARKTFVFTEIPTPGPETK